MYKRSDWNKHGFGESGRSSYIDFKGGVKTKHEGEGGGLENNCHGGKNSKFNKREGRLL